MKRLLAVVLSIALIAGLGVPSAADYVGEFSPNEKVYLYGSDFVDSDGNSLTDSLHSDYYALSYSFSAASEKYIQSVKFDDSDNAVVITFRQDIAVTSNVSIKGTIAVREKELKKRYTLKLDNDDLVLKKYESNTVVGNDKVFELPHDYQSGMVKFDLDGNTYGTFKGQFGDDAYFETKVVDQKPLYLGYNTNENTALIKAYPNATLRFLTWTSTPKFEVTGTLKIYAKSSEYVYGVSKDNTLYSLGATYSNTDGAYVFKTNTLGAYVISDRALTAAAVAEQHQEVIGAPVSKNPHTGQ